MSYATFFARRVRRIYPTFLAVFGKAVGRPNADGVIESGYDYTALDQVMPHPVYGNMYWLCVLNPSLATFEQVKPLLAEAYASAARNEKEHPASAGTAAA